MLKEYALDWSQFKVFLVKFDYSTEHETTPVHLLLPIVVGFGLPLRSLV